MFYPFKISAITILNRCKCPENIMFSSKNGQNAKQYSLTHNVKILSNIGIILMITVLLLFEHKLIGNIYFLTPIYPALLR